MPKYTPVSKSVLHILSIVTRWDKNILKTMENTFCKCLNSNLSNSTYKWVKVFQQTPISVTNFLCASAVFYWRVFSEKKLFVLQLHSGNFEHRSTKVGSNELQYAFSNWTSIICSLLITAWIFHCFLYFQDLILRSLRLGNSKHYFCII